MVSGDTIETIPTIGFNVESFKSHNTKFVAWDVGGRGRVSTSGTEGLILTIWLQIRALHRHYYQGSDAVVYIVDAAEPEVMQDAIDEFSKMVDEPELQDCIFMLLANKQDLPQALSAEEIANRFNVKNVKQTILVQGISGASGDGLNEAFSWLAKTLKGRKQTKWGKFRESFGKYTSFLRCTSPQEQIIG